MREQYYDTRDGTVIIGAAALEDRYADPLEDAEPYIVPMSEAITRPDAPVNPDYVENPGWDDSDRDKLMEYGAWSLRLMRLADPGSSFDRNTISRLHIMGLYPRRTIADSKRIGGRLVASINEVVGGGMNDSRYNKFSDRGLIDCVDQAADRLGGRKPQPDDLDTLARQRKGPSASYIEKNVGLQNAYEALGFPDFSTYDAEDLLHWCSKTMLINGRFNLSPEVLDILAWRGSGPERAQVLEHYVNLRSFVAQASDNARREYEHNERRRHHFLERYEQLEEEGLVPTDTVDIKNDEQRILYAAKADTILRFSNHEQRQSVALIAVQPMSQIASTIQQRFPYLSAREKTTTYAEIDAVIAELDATDLIYPEPDISKRLLVSEEDIRTWRQRNEPRPAEDTAESQAA